MSYTDEDAQRDIMRMLRPETYGRWSRRLRRERKEEARAARAGSQPSVPPAVKQRTKSA